MSSGKDNPLNFKLVSADIKKIDNSPLYQVALAYNSGQYYAAAADPITKKNYVLYVEISDQGAKYAPKYAEIPLNTPERNAVEIYFQKAAVFEQFYKGRNWVWQRNNGKDNVHGSFLNRLNSTI